MNRTFILFLSLCLMVQLGNAQTLVWGDMPGQGDFDGGLNGWTVQAEVPGVDSAWYWSANGDVGEGAFANPGTSINSPTASNGSVIFHYDFFVTDGDVDNAPPFPYTDMTSHLISPEIDISGAPSKFLFVRLHQMMAKLNSVPGNPINGISFTQDGGLTWFPDTPIDCSPDREINVLFDESMDINIPSENLDLNLPLQMRFTYAGDFYWWVLDDIEIYVRPSHETRANSFFSVAPNRQTPVGQMPDAGFLIDVENLGSAIAPNVRALVSINDPSGTEIFSDVLEYGDLTQDSLAENQPFPNFFPTDLGLGTYTGTYTVVTDSMENDPNNNTQTFSFTMTDSTFAKETGTPATDVTLNRDLFDGAPWTYAVGSHYLIPNGSDLFARTVSFSINNNISGDDESNITDDIIFVKLYEWVEQGAADGVASPAERTEIASSFHTVQAGDNLNKLITVVLTDNQGQIAPIPLKDDTHYLVVLEYFSNDTETTMYVASSEAIDYGARVFQDFLRDSFQMNYTQVVGIGEDLANTDYSATFIFGNDNVPVIRLNVGSTPIDVATNDLPELGSNEMALSPVPAKNFLNIDLDLNDIANDATIEIYSSEGRIMDVIALGKVQEEKRTINLETYLPGTYFARFISAEGVLTKPFQVIQ